MFEFDNLKQFVKENGANSPEQIIDDLFLALNEFGGDAPRHDDVTVVVVKRDDC